MTRLTTTVLSLLLLSCFVGCSFKQHKANADLTIQRYFDAIKNNSIDDAIKCFSPKFFEHTAEPELRKILAASLAKLGEFDRYEVVSWSMNVGTQTHCSFACKSYYAMGEAQEAFVLVNDGPDGAMQIVNWNITSKAFLDIEA